MKNFYLVYFGEKLVAIRCTSRTYSHALADENGAYTWFGRPDLAHAHKRRYPLANLEEVKSVSREEWLKAGKLLAQSET